MSHSGQEKNIASSEQKPDAEVKKTENKTRDGIVGWVVIVGLGYLAWTGISGVIGWATADSSDAVAETARPTTVLVAKNETTSAITQEQPKTAAFDESLDFKINGRSATIKGIRLGDGPDVCNGTMKVMNYGTNYGMGFVVESKINGCKIGVPSDMVTVIFDKTASKVISVERVMYTSHDKMDIKEFLGKSEEFYGKPDFSDYGNYMIGYGNSFKIKYQGERAYESQVDSGRGILIQAELCILGGEDDNCRGIPGIDTRIKMKLNDVGEYYAAYAAGEELVKQEKSKAANVQF